MPNSPRSVQNTAISGRSGSILAGRYELLEPIAVGGMAEVWEGLDLVLERHVAVKVLHAHLAADPGFRQRFRTEALAAARLRHPSIVAVFDTCQDTASEAMVMELLEGRTLRAFLDERGPLHPADVVQMGADVADALAAAHRAGVIHRDIKPANILLCDDGRVVVTDFGIAKVRDGHDLTTTGTMLGTVRYLSPEQVAGERITPAADQYSLGVVLYESLTGRPPFDTGNAAATALARLQQDAPPLREARPDVPADLAAAVERALRRRPEDRYPTTTDMRASLLAVRLQPGPEPTVQRPTNAPTRPGRPDDRSHPNGPSPTVGPGPTDDPSPTDDTAVVVAPIDRTGVIARQGADPHLREVPERGRTGPRRRRGRLWASLVLAVVVAGSLGLAAVLVGGTEPGEDLLEPVLTPVTDPPPLEVTGAFAFDPEGVDGENDQYVAFAVDGDPTTTWRTQRYDNRHFGNLKSGVGLAVTLNRPAELDSVRVESPSQGWSGQVFVADGLAEDLAGWGQPVATLTDVRGATTVSLGDARGEALLLWITDLGRGDGRVALAEVVPSS